MTNVVSTQLGQVNACALGQGLPLSHFKFAGGPIIIFIIIIIIITIFGSKHFQA